MRNWKALAVACAATLAFWAGPAMAQTDQTPPVEAKLWAMLEESASMQSLRFEQVSVRRLGERHTLAGFSTVWERTPKGWRVIHDHSS